MKPFLCILYVIMFLCDSLVRSSASRAVPSRGSRDQVTAGYLHTYCSTHFIFTYLSSAAHIRHICTHMSGANDKGCIGSGVAGTIGSCGIIQCTGTAMAVATGI